MYEFPSPMLQSSGMYNTTQSLTFIDKVPSKRFFKYWKLLQRKLDIEHLPGGKELIYLNGKNRQEFLQKLQFLPEDEVLEFVHWASIESHEYIHGFDFLSSEFGYMIFLKLMDQMLLSLDILKPSVKNLKLPLLSKTSNRLTNSSFETFFKTYDNTQRSLDLLLGNQIKIGRLEYNDPNSFIWSFLPAERPGFDFPLPAINLSSMGLGSEVIPFSTRHIIEGRAILAQYAEISRLFYPKLAEDYWKEIWKRSLTNSGYLDYCLAIMVINYFFGEDNIPSMDLVFNLLDLSLQIMPSESDPHFKNIYPPVILLLALQELSMAGKIKKKVPISEIKEFIEKNPLLPKRNQLLKSRYNDIKDRIDFIPDHPLDKIAHGFEKLRLEFIKARLKNEELTLSPFKLTENIFTSLSLPRLPLVIKRKSNFEELSIFFSKEDEFVNYFFLFQNIMSDLLYNYEIICPYKKLNIDCGLKNKKCGTHKNYYLKKKKTCFFGEVLEDMNLPSRII